MCCKANAKRRKGRADQDASSTCGCLGFGLLCGLLGGFLFVLFDLGFLLLGLGLPGLLAGLCGTRTTTFDTPWVDVAEDTELTSCSRYVAECLGTDHQIVHQKIMLRCFGIHLQDAVEEGPRMIAY